MAPHTGGLGFWSNTVPRTVRVTAYPTPTTNPSTRPCATVCVPVPTASMAVAMVAMKQVTRGPTMVAIPGRWPSGTMLPPARIHAVPNTWREYQMPPSAKYAMVATTMATQWTWLSVSNVMTPPPWSGSGWSVAWDEARFQEAIRSAIEGDRRRLDDRS